MTEQDAAAAEGVYDDLDEQGGEDGMGEMHDANDGAANGDGEENAYDYADEDQLDYGDEGYDDDGDAGYEQQVRHAHAHSGACCCCDADCAHGVRCSLH
jgi:hypothetical protein